MFVLKSGSAEVRRHDPLGQLAPIVVQGPGEFVAEIGQLSGQPALVDVHAVGDLATPLIPPQNLRALLIVETELGDRIMRALILRRVTLIIGPASRGDMVRLQAFLARNAHPYQVLDPAEDHDAATLIEQYGAQPTDLPLAVCPKGTVLKNPRESELARTLDMTRFIRTGANNQTSRRRSGDQETRPLPLESNVLGVFAVGDIPAQARSSASAARLAKARR